MNHLTRVCAALLILFTLFIGYQWGQGDGIHQGRAQQKEIDYKLAVLPHAPPHWDSRERLVCIEAGGSYGVDPVLLFAIHRQENGRVYREMGYDGLSKYHLSVPPEQRQYFECAKRVADLQAQYQAAHMEDVKTWWLFLAEGYHRGTRAENLEWAHNVRWIAHHMREESK
jgi:hypothetical protein